MTTLLICNGEPPSRDLIRRMLRRADRLVAVDGGANAARAINVRPDLILGDLDSVTPATRRTFAKVPTIRIPSQDNTDLEKALDHCEAEGDTAMIIAGATGRRLDMTLANLSVCWHYLPDMDICFVGDDWYAVPVIGKRAFVAPPGTTVSLIPFGPASGVTLQGLQFPLVEGTFRTGDVAVSNVVRGHKFSVSVRRGRLLVLVLTRFGEH
jgi:thiamine pyrophosphokinase